MGAVSRHDKFAGSIGIQMPWPGSIGKGLAADLQNLQKAAGTAADLKKQSDDAQKALADAVSARTSAQNDLAELTKQINEAKVAVSNAQEEARAKASDTARP